MPTPDGIRTVAVVGHSHDGKTTLCEALLHTAGATQRLGSTDAGTSILDHEPEEQRRSISITAALAHCDWKGMRLNLIDLPGFQDFAGEVAAGLSVADAAVLVVSAGGSIPVGAELAWEMISERHLPTLIVVNKMDKDNAAYEATVDALRESFSRKPVAVAVPIGNAQEFHGYVDLVDDRAHTFEAGGATASVEVPGAMLEEVERAHAALVEAAADTDDALIERYLEGGALSDDEVRGALHSAVLRGTLVPIVCAAALPELGAGLVLDAITRYLPGPLEEQHPALDAAGAEIEIAPDPAGPLVMQVFKTTVDTFGKVSFFKVLRGTVRADTHPFNAQRHVEERFAQLGRPMGKGIEPATEIGAGDIGVATKLAVTSTGDTLCARDTPVTVAAIAYPADNYSAAIHARTKGDEDKISHALARYHDEDPTFRTDRDAVTSEVLVRGLGDVHLAVALERMARKYSVAAQLDAPTVPYRETITGTARVQHKYKKQSGGAGLYGDCTIEIEPLPRGEGFIWEDRIFGGSIPQQFRPSVEKGVRQTLDRGAIAGYPIVDVRVRLLDGSTHAVDGKDIAFQIAGSMAMRDAVRQAQPVLLEPIMSVRVVVPDTLMGDAMSLVNGRRGRVAGMNPLGDGRSEITASIPQSEMYTFPIDLRAMTQGRGRFTMEVAHYEEVPTHIAQPLIEAHGREHAAVAS